MKLQPTDKIALAMYEAAERDKKESRYYLGMSQIGACSRMLWLNFRGFKPVPFDGRVLMIFRLGDRIEEEVIHHLSLCYNISDRQLSFEDHNGLFRGHCDGVIEGITHRKHILEIKSANDKSFKEFQKKGVKEKSPTYYAQMQCYMGYSLLERALFVVYNKNTSDIYTERVYFDPDEFFCLKKKAQMIIEEDIPPKDTQDNCDWCSQKHNCEFGENLMTDRICGTCYYMSFFGTKPKCMHPGHNFFIEKWGIYCDDYCNNYSHDDKPKVEKIKICNT